MQIESSRIVRALVVVIVAALGAAFTACGGDDGGSNDETSAAEKEEQQELQEARDQVQEQIDAVQKTPSDEGGYRIPGASP
jgi:hypothetical protein